MLVVPIKELMCLRVAWPANRATNAEFKYVSGTIPGFLITSVDFNSIGFVWRAPIIDEETLNYTVKCTDNQGSEHCRSNYFSLGRCVVVYQQQDFTVAI